MTWVCGFNNKFKNDTCPCIGLYKYTDNAEEQQWDLHVNYYLRRKVRDVYDLRHIPKKRGRRPEAAAPFSYKSTYIHIHTVLFDVNNSLHANLIAVLQHCPYIYKGQCMEMYHFWIYYWTHRPTSLLLRRFLYMTVARTGDLWTGPYGPVDA